jgi:O-antigen/teichoic acid export membrane protein
VLRAEGKLMARADTRLITTVGRNTIYQIASQVAPALAALTAIPLLLRHLGPETFGIVTIFSTSLIYFTMLDLGLGRAATRFVAQSLESGRLDDLRGYFWGSLILLSGIGMIVAAAGFWAVPTIVYRFLKIPELFLRPTVQSFQLICATVPLVALTATFRGYLEASGRFFYVSLVAGLTGVANYLLPLLVVIKGGGLVVIAASFAAIRLALCLAFAFGCFKTKNRSSLRPAFDSAAIARMLSFGGWLSVSNIVGTAIIYCDRFLLGVWVGMAAVANYGMPLDVIGRLQILIVSFCAVLFPLMSRLDESGSEHFHSVYRGAIAVSLSFMTVLASLAVLLAPFLMRLWLGSRNSADAVFAAQVFLAGTVVQSTASIAWTALHARGRTDLTAWLHLVEFPLYCLAFYLAASRFGVHGASLVWFGRVVIDYLCMIVLLRVHRRRGELASAPELVAAAVSVGILFVSVLPLTAAIILAMAVCSLTCFWSWNKLLDPAMRSRLAAVLSMRRNVGALS